MLFRDNERVRLGSRARQILVSLIARSGEIVSKADLMLEVWPDTTVVENNLTVHIAALRQALGEERGGPQYVVNVPGRGYRFVGQVRHEPEVASLPVASAQAPFPTNLPGRLRSVVNLAKPIEEVTTKLRGGNLVTVTGSAGVGKTTLALHVAKGELSRHRDGVWLIELAALTKAEHIPAAIAATIQVELGAGDPNGELVTALMRRQILLLLDNCEHLIDAAAGVAAMILRQCPGVVLLTTSREPLRVHGEAIYGLAPLETPPSFSPLDARTALAYPAVELFVGQVAALTNDYALSDEDAISVASICRRLDGLPLAIEFASPLVAAFGIAGLAARLDDRSRLMQSEMRGASERHRTLTTALDWSYGLLDEKEQTALRRLAVFASGFTLEGAAAVVGVEDLGELGGLLARLHAKSLITRDVSSKDLRFRLLETTRAFAIGKLEHEDSAAEIRRRHVAFLVQVFGQNGAALREASSARSFIDDVRRGLDWAMSPLGHAQLGCDLVVASAPLWFDLRLISEFHGWAHRAAASASSISPLDAGLEMRLANILALADRENGVTAISQRALVQALRLAEEMGDATQELIALIGLFGSLNGDLECELADAYAARVGPTAERAGHPAPGLIHESYRGYSLFFLGRSPEARQVSTDTLALKALRVGSPPALPFEIDPRISALINRSRANWVCGFPDQAREDIENALSDAMRLDHLPTLYQVLVSGAPVSLWLRDLPLARRMLDIVRANAESLQVGHWKNWGDAFELILAPLLDEPSPGQASEFVRREMEFLPRRRAIACTAHDSHFGSWIDQRMDRDGAVWCREEVYRLRGLRHLHRHGEGGAPEAECLIRSALDLADRQGARSWALRAAMSLSEVLCVVGRAEEGRAVVAARYAEFSEGFSSFDLQRASRVLDTA